MNDLPSTKSEALMLDPSPQALPQRTLSTEFPQDSRFPAPPQTATSPIASPSVDRTTSVPLWLPLTLSGLALVALGALIGMKMSDYQHEKYFAQVFGDYSLMREETQRALEDLTTATAQAASTASALRSAPQNAAYDPGNSGSYLPPFTDPSAPRQQNADELAALQQERKMVSQRFEQLSSIGSSQSAQSSSPPSTSRFAPIDTARALPSRASSTLSDEDLKIKNDPAIAGVSEYESDWHFVVIDGGQERNLSPGTQLAIRRGHTILGLIRLDEVLENESVGELIGPWKADSQAPKPSRGDSVIPYPLF
ncbi:MAG: hypothetical protein AAGJ31_12730 [Verrucomicrobiota bacterium]